LDTHQSRRREEEKKKGSQPSFPQCMRHDYDCLKRPVLLSHVGLADAVSSEVGNVEGANAHFILVFFCID
jgi:hypothetical protein